MTKLKTLKLYSCVTKIFPLAIQKNPGNQKYPYIVFGSDFNDNLPYDFDFKASVYKRLLEAVRIAYELERVRTQTIWISPTVVSVEFSLLPNAESFAEILSNLTPDDFRHSCEKYPMFGHLRGVDLYQVLSMTPYLMRLEELESINEVCHAG